MEGKRIEDKLKEYRKRKELERLAQIRAAQPLYERVLPNVLAAPVAKILRATKTPSPANSDSSTNEHSNEVTEPTEVAPDTVKCDDEVTNDLQRRSAVLKHRPKKSVKFQDPIAQRNVFASDDLERSSSSDPSDSRLWIVLLGLKIVLWVILFILSVKFEWGAVFVIFSAFYVIFTNLRSDKRKPWEPSAYSVFNPDCHAIDGTLKAEQFEKEIRYGF